MNAGYEWRKGSPFRANANAFAAQLQTLKGADGAKGLTVVLEASKPEGAPLHDEIEWDDESAAHKHRLDVVRDAMAALRVIPVDIVREELLPPVRAAIPVRMVGGVDAEMTPNAYRLTVTLTTMQEYEQSARAEAMGNIRQLANRLRTIPGCADLAEKLMSIVDFERALELA